MKRAALPESIYRLYGQVQHYSWGGYDYIPQLLGKANPDRQPFAEYWMGAHPLAGARLGKELQPLDQLVRRNPEAVLGRTVAAQFHELPYLFKILDVRDMLSIQVHPNKAAAEREFAAENARGVSLTDPARNYKDANHKPELMVALSEFWLLHGFKPEDRLHAILEAVEELRFLAPVLDTGGCEALYRTVMEMPAVEVNRRLQPLLDRIVPPYQAGALTRDQEDFWAARAALTFNRPGSIDRGIFSIYLFNLVHLHAGQGIFQDAGVPHAYLEGQNAEIMANSDNVLRGGLTTKHIDVPELLKHVQFRPVLPDVLEGVAGLPGEIVYRTPAREFELSRIRLGAAERCQFTTRSGEILLVLEGRVRIHVANELTSLGRGQSVFVLAGQPVEMKAVESTVLFRATVPVHNGE